MLKLSGYEIHEQLSTSTRSQIFRARRSADQQPVIIKIPAPEFPTPQDLSRFRHEFDMGGAIDDPHVIHYDALEDYSHGLALIQEDFGAEALAQVIPARGLELSAFLPIAMQLAAGLEAIHRSGVTHRQIHPHNLVINPDTRVVKFIDFGMASRLKQDTQPATSPNRLEGSLAYLSPEQTGRMRQAIDDRTDLYSLGVTFYQMLTGSVPFPSDDPLEVIHGHLAIRPKPVREVSPHVPQPVSAIVEKLLAKSSDARYQSASGLKKDLETCLKQWTATGSVEHFAIPQDDVPERFQLPQKLYGREREVDALLEAFERVAAGHTEVILVAGYSGIGKTSVVSEIHKPLLRQRGYFVSGKFDPHTRHIPYSAVIEAFQQLLQQILTESDEAIAVWRKNLREALGSYAQVMIDVLPELELIVGTQASVAPLDAKASHNRFMLFVQKFVSVFAKQEHPLAVFLDDLQRADMASLDLIQAILSGSDGNSLFLIGAYRENEVDRHHPLLKTIDEIQKTGTPLHVLSLDPLTREHVHELIADTLRCSKEHSRPLAELVYAKTAGNPFFVRALLTSLSEEHLLSFEPDSGWAWEIHQIRQLGMTDNVADLMVRKLSRLPQPTQEVLTLAACIGNRFDLGTLATISQHSEAATSVAIVDCLQEGLVVHLDDAYRFAHDRIQQAAYALIDDDQRAEQHVAIGRLLLDSSRRSADGDELSEERLFAIVTHLNIGMDLVTQQTERDDIARLNLLAGRKAKAAAYATALHYFRAGITYLRPHRSLLHAHTPEAEDTWQRQYDLTRDLCVGAAEAAYLSTEFEETERWAAEVLQHASRLLDNVSVQEVRIQAYTAQSRLLEAIDLALEVLKLLGIEFSEASAESQMLAALKKTQTALAAKSFEDLLHLPAMTDPDKLAASRIMDRLLAPAFIVAPKLFTCVVLKMVHASLEWGENPETALVYALYGMILCAKGQEADAGYRFGQLALKLLERGGAEQYKARTSYVAYWAIFPWKDPLKSVLQPLAETYQTGLEIGDQESAAMAAAMYCILAYFAGKELAFLEREMATYRQRIRQLKQETLLYMVEIFHQTVLNLLGRGDDPCRLVGETYNEEVMLPRYHATQNGTALLQSYFNKMVLCYLFEEHNQAVEHAAMATQYLERAIGWMLSALFYFYDSLVRLRMFPDEASPEQERILQKIAANQEQLAIRARHAPMTHLHKWYLVEAERARVLQHEGEARVAYDKAIDLAYQHDSLQDAALANELAAKFYHTLGKDRVARLYFREASASYLKWGAVAKVKQLEERYAQYLAQPRTEPGTAVPATVELPSTRAIDSAALDFSTTLKAAQALSREIQQDKLLATLMTIVIENVGAQRGVFLAERHGQLFIVARQHAEHQASTDFSSLPLESSDDASLAIIHYVRRTRESLVIDDAVLEQRFASDPYIIQHQPRSIVCLPVISQANLVGLLYLENNLTTHAFTPQRLELLHVLSSQMAISLENARLYVAMEQEIDERRRAEEALNKALVGVAQLQEQLQAENVYLQQEIQSVHPFEEIIGRSQPLLEVLHQVDRVAPTEATVLILGETGTGKELIARAIHSRSARKNRPLVKVSCAAIPPTLIESEFFGHEKGAFTGALTRKDGRFELAAGGTIFLDEIGELPVDLQVKLLRVLQEGEFERLGSTTTTKVDVRVIAATNRNLAQAVAAGEFRADLYYRLNVFPVTLPPLRDRREDIPLLVWYFITKSQGKLGKTIDRVPERVMAALMAYTWPGNIRELANVLERAIILSPGATLALDEVLGTTPRPDQSAAPAPSLEDVERAHILAVLEACQWRIKGAGQAAARLGLPPSTLRSRMKKLGITRSR
jgi:predicted ATPase/transcriptional regulator with GAF, ATPase, and Fis domain